MSPNCDSSEALVGLLKRHQEPERGHSAVQFLSGFQLRTCKGLMGEVRDDILRLPLYQPGIQQIVNRVGRFQPGF